MWVATNSYTIIIAIVAFAIIYVLLLKYLLYTFHGGLDKVIQVTLLYKSGIFH